MCDYAEAYILLDGTIRATNAVNATILALKNYASFTKCNLEINDEHVDTAENLDIVMPMYNLIEYSDNYQDSLATLYQYKRDEPPEADAVADLTANNENFRILKISESLWRKRFPAILIMQIASLLFFISRDFFFHMYCNSVLFILSSILLAYLLFLCS